MGIVWIIWLVFCGEAVLLGLTGFWFSLSTLRWLAWITGVALVIAVTAFGAAHLDPGSSANFVNAFLSGVDQVTIALFNPLWPGQPLTPGIADRWVIAAVLLLGYRLLEGWTLHWQAPVLDLSTVGRGRPTTAPSDSGAGHDQSTAGDDSPADDHRNPAAAKPTAGQRHAQLAAELRFRLPTMEVRSPAILPGGTRANALASIAESTGVSGAGMIGAAFRFAGLFWPSPARIRVRTWVESPEDSSGAWGSTEPRVTVLLENAKTGLPVASKTVNGQTFNEAASMVAGYIARWVFAMDRSVPGYCYGLADGRDLGAMQLARMERVYAKCPDDVTESRRKQIDILNKATGSIRAAGIVRYEFAQLLALQGEYLAALRLHAMNRELHPRFYRGRYRLATSLEMIANQQCFLPDAPKTRDELRETLEILARCELPKEALDETHRFAEILVTGPTGDVLQCVRLCPELAEILLKYACDDLRDVRKHLTQWSVMRDAIFRRAERNVWVPHWRPRHRRAFTDGVCVAELMIAVRRALTPGNKQRLTWLERWHLGRALRITMCIADKAAPISKALVPEGRPWTVHRRPWQRRSASWQAAYNTACVYAALADAALREAAQAETALEAVAVTEIVQAEAAAAEVVLTHAPIGEAALAGVAHAARATKALGDLAALREGDKRELQELERQVIAGLRRAVDHPQSELERPSDWIETDPDFSVMRKYSGVFDAFRRFRDEQQRQDYPAAEGCATRHAVISGTR